MIESVASILISTEDEFILQKRDDKPGVIQPGKITNFGGGLKAGEDPLDAIAREIEEELLIKLSRQDFRLLGSFAITDPTDRPNQIKHVYIARNIQKENLRLKEGQAIVYLKTKDSLELAELSQNTREVLKLFQETLFHLPLEQVQLKTRR
ncbi:MAG: NUDIX domain-containing protein [Candidatus Harrisonbacteria bacterium]|nr:NUDIX domain-containing protein [Candidatus Harrisonbacteria bacterium]